jgi:protein-S-isoprenylcysteine O-methyltransferase Ste14
VIAMRQWCNYSMIPRLNLLGWLACVVYSTIPSFWFLVHPRAEYWRSRRRSPYLVLLPAWVVMWVGMGLITARWRRIDLYAGGWTWVPALFLFGMGMWLYAQSSKNFSARQLGGLPELVPGHREQRLVTTGIRARVRHPVYVAHLCEMLAWSVGTGLVVCYSLTAFAMFTGGVMIRMEDRELEARFGEEYRQYRARVSAMIPKVRE